MQKKKKKKKKKPCKLLGVLMYEAGIIYFSDHFDSSTTKPVINTIIEKNPCSQKERPKRNYTSN